MLNRLTVVNGSKKLSAISLACACVLGVTLTPRSVAQTATPIQHLVVIFQENVSFDHYFGTYPNALNLSGEPKFKAPGKTPVVNGLNNALLNFNPNLNPANGGRFQSIPA